MCSVGALPRSQNDRNFYRQHKLKKCRNVLYRICHFFNFRYPPLWSVLRYPFLPGWARTRPRFWVSCGLPCVCPRQACFASWWALWRIDASPSTGLASQMCFWLDFGWSGGGGTRPRLGEACLLSKMCSIMVEKSNSTFPFFFLIISAFLIFCST